MSVDTIPDPKGKTFTEFAQAIAEIASGSQASRLESDLMKRLRKLSDAVNQQLERDSFPKLAFDLVEEHYKVVLGLGLQIACAQSSARKQQKVLDATLLAVATGSASGFCQWTRDLALTELAYVDQFLITSGGCDVRDHLSHTLLSIPVDRQWNPPLRDYNEAKLPADRRRTRTDGPTVFLVGSVKGGVGKSLCSAIMLSEFGKKTRTALIDLDSSGPTAQFHFNSPGIASALSLLPSPSKREPRHNREWVYGTSADVFCGEELSGPVLRQRVKEAVYSIIAPNGSGGKAKEDKNRYILVLPDSVSVSGRVSDSMRGGSSQYKTAIIVAEMIRKLHREMRFEKVILDLGPGLSAVNAILLSHLTRHFRTRGVFLSSPRTSDIGTSLYEASWMAAQGEYHWDGPLLHIANMWPEKYAAYKTQLCTWTNRSIALALRAGISGQSARTTSAAQILSWRLWSVLYLVSVPKRFEKKRLLLTTLPFDEKVRDFMAPPPSNDQDQFTDVTFELRMGDLKGSKWYRAFKNHIAEWVKECS